MKPRAGEQNCIPTKAKEREETHDKRIKQFNWVVV